MSAQRTATASQSFTTEPSSPPTYWIGLLILGSNASSRPNTDSTLITSQRTRGVGAGIALPLSVAHGRVMLRRNDRWHLRARRSFVTWRARTRDSPMLRPDMDNSVPSIAYVIELGNSRAAIEA